MCGIAGFLTPTPLVDPEGVLHRMNETLIHRGPDAGAIWLDQRGSTGFAHRRLAIVDLTEEGRQPMHSASGRYTIAFNGEIYNFQRLRKELESLGHKFRGHSDTEVMLAALEEWGLESSLDRFVGMFAFALWDSSRNELTLARDRLGKKPLYYASHNGALIFGSELKALQAFPGFSAAIDRSALTLYLRHNYVPSPYSIYEGVRKLEAAHFIRVGSTRGATVEREKKCFWRAAVRHGVAVSSPIDLSLKEATDELDRLLGDAVALRMIADVPLGAFLSGGVDSSVVVALMQAHSRLPVRTFTIGFHEREFNEAEHAKAVARHLHTDHTEVYLTPEETLAVIPKLPDLYDEPFADSSQVPTALVCAMARRHVTVALSGDGGDEGFCGYTRYAHAGQLWRSMSQVPAAMRRAIAWAVKRVPAETWDVLLEPVRILARQRFGSRASGHKIHRGGDRLASATPQQLYRHLMSYWLEPASVVVDGAEPSLLRETAPRATSTEQFMNQMMLLDAVTYLPDDILVKVDRASMAVSLEVRAPLLDHRVLEFAWSLPLGLKHQGGRGKVILRELLRRYVPDRLVDRPKVGFGVPIDAWLRAPLRAWAEDLLNESRLKREGYFDAAAIRRLWHSHVTGRGHWGYQLWGILMFEAWLEKQRQLGAAHGPGFASWRGETAA